MAKAKVKKVKTRRDIPYSERMTHNHYREIAANREDAAITVLRIACVALNDTEGMGYNRICRFAARTTALCKEYYADPERGEAQLNRRLSSMGFDTAGGGMRAAFDADGKPVKISSVKQGGA